MASQKITTVDIKGRTYDIYASEAGDWYAVVDGSSIRAETMKALEAKLRKLAVKVSIPFVRFEHHTGKIRRGTVTGSHARNGSILVSYGKGATDSVSWEGSNVHYFPGDIAQGTLDRIADLAKTMLAAEQDFETAVKAEQVHFRSWAEAGINAIQNKETDDGK